MNKWKNFKVKYEDDIYIIAFVFTVVIEIVVATFLIVLLIITSIQSQQKIETQKQLMENLTNCELVNTNEINIIDYSEATEKIISNRNGKLLIVKQIAIITDDLGNGKILNGRFEEIRNYSKLPGGVNKGDIVTTYLIYNPDTNAINDITMDYNYITYTEEK